MQRVISVFLVFISTSTLAVAGGRPDHVEYPADYRKTFSHYTTQNRANNKQLAMMYANRAAVDSVSSGQLAAGSIVIMEIYKPELDASGKPVAGASGLFTPKVLAAVAVMEKRTDWKGDYPAAERAGDWGFALYDPQGEPKPNDLVCASCHTPLTDTDFMFTLSKLAGR